MSTSSVRSLGNKVAADQRITISEAQQLATEAKKGEFTEGEKAELRNIINVHATKFDPGAKAELEKALGSSPAAAPPTQQPSTNTTTQAKPLNPTGGADRAVYIAADGTLTTDSKGAKPKDAKGTADALFRTAQTVDDSSNNMFADARLPESTRRGTFNQVKASLDATANGKLPAGFTANQALQLRASAGTTLLHLMDATPESGLKGEMAATVDGMIRGEKNVRLRENLIFNLSNTASAKTSPVKEISQKLMTELAPTTPPYEKWFAGGNKTVNLSWTVGGGGEFYKGFSDQLKKAGFKAVGTENFSGVSTYERTVNKPGVGDTTFRVSVREGGTGFLAPMNDPKVHVVGYDGHSNWGRNANNSVKNSPADSGDGKLIFYNMCVGKTMLDKMKEKHPNAQIATTFAASMFYVGPDKKMTDGEGVRSLLAMMDGISTRADWSTLHQKMNAAATIKRDRTWDNYVTPISTQVREQMLDRDNDGQADYLDKHFNFDTQNVAEDTKREFTPIRSSHPTHLLDGTKVIMAGQMINTISEFSSIMERVNKDSRVIPNGYFEPKSGESALVKFTNVNGNFHMQVNARLAHMSEEALRAVAAYEFSRHVTATGQLKMDPLDAKLNSLILAGQSLKVDEGFRDDEVWKQLLSRHNLPPIALSKVMTLLNAEHHHYSGSPEMVAKLKASLTAQELDALKQPAAGEPTRVIG